MNKYIAYLFFCFSIITLTIIEQSFADLPGKVFSKYVHVNQTEKIELKDDIDLSELDLKNCKINRQLSELRNIVFDKSILSGSDLDETCFINCSFRKTNMSGVVAPSSLFRDCDFADATIIGSNFVLTKEQFCSTASYRNKSIQGTEFHLDISGINFSDYNLRNVGFYGSFVHGCNFSDSLISGASFSGKYEKRDHSKDYGYLLIDNFSCNQLFTTKDYKQGTILDVNFFAVDFSRCNFSKMNLTGCRFNPFIGIEEKIYCDFSNTDMTDAVISHCVFHETKNLTFEQIKSTWNYKVGRMEGIVLPKQIQDLLDAEKHER